MSRYLSTEWLAELDAAVRGAAVGPLPILTVEQRVTGTDGGVVVYHLAADGQTARVRPGPTPGGADLAFTQDVVTACAIARGELGALEALQSGRIRLDGDAARLRAAVPLFTAVGEATADLRETTEFPRAG